MAFSVFSHPHPQPQVCKFDRPAQSPDLNPVKHLWDEFEFRLHARPCDWDQYPKRIKILSLNDGCMNELWKQVYHTVQCDLCPCSENILILNLGENHAE